MKNRVISHMILWAVCSLLWLPLLMMAGNSLMSAAEMKDRFGPVLEGTSGWVKGTLFPDYPTLRPYAELLLDSPGFFVMFWNSWIHTAGILAGQLAAAVPAAWAFGTYEFPGKKALFGLYLLLMVLPFQVMMVPDYLVLNKLQLVNTHWAVILPAVFSAFPVIILTQFFASIPRSLLDAARLDGAGEVKIFFYVGIPMGYPGIMAASVLGFLESWNAVEPAMAFLKEKPLWPLSLYLPHITVDKASVSWAASVIASLPPLLFFLSGQAYLEQGIVLSGIKE